MVRAAPPRIALFLAALLALGGITAYVAVEAFRALAAEIRSDVTQDLLAALSLRRQQIEFVLSERQGDATIFATRASMALLLDPATPPETREAARRTSEQTVADYAGLYGYRRILVLDPRLEPVLGAGDRRLLPVELVALRKALASRAPLVAELHQAAGGAVVYGIARPILPQGMGADAAPLGVAYLEIEARGPRHGLVDSWSAARRSLRLALLREAGGAVEMISLADGPGSPAWRIETLPRQAAGPIVAAALAAPGGAILRIEDAPGGPRVAATSPVAGMPWVLLASLDAGEIGAPLRRMGWTIALAAGVILVCLAVAAAMARRWQIGLRLAREAAVARRYAAALAAMEDGLLRIGMDGRITDANAAAAGLTGYDKAALQGMAIGVLAPDQPEAPPAAARMLTRWRRRSGEMIDVEVTSTLVPDETGGHAYLIARDVTGLLNERRRLYRLNLLHRLMIRAFRAIGHSHDPRCILREVCEGLELDESIRLVGALWVDHEAGRVVKIAASGPAAGCLDEAVITLDPALPTSDGPTGRCVREGRPVVVQAIRQHPMTRPWHEAAAKWELGSSISLPIAVGGRTIAVLVLYSRHDSHFEGDEVDLAGDMSRTLSMALEAAASRQAEAELAAVRAASEARLQGLMRALPMPMHIVSASSGRLRSANAAAVQLFGYREDAFPTIAAWLDAACPDAEARARYDARRAAAVEEARAGGEPVRMPELPVRGRDGRLRIVQAYVSVVGDDVLKAWADLTDIHAQRTALHRREEIYAAIVAATADAVVLIRAVDGAFLEFNTAAHAGLGYGRDAFAAMRVADIAPGFRDSADGARVRGLALGEGCAFEHELVGADGAARPVRVSVQRILVDGEHCLAGIWSDLGEERRRATALAAEAEKHRVLFESAAQGIVVISLARARIIQANPAAMRMLGCTAEVLVGSPPWQWSVDNPSEAVWRARWAPPVTETRRTTRFRRHDGSTFDVDLVWSFASLDGETVAFVNIVDATERLRTDKELRRAERMSVVGQLTGGIAHDFNNLLTVISLNLEVAVDTMAPEDELRPLLATALDAAQRGGELNSQLLSYARRQTLRPVPTDIDAFLGPLQDMAARAVGVQHPIEHLRRGGLPWCGVDQAKLESAVLNLILNARDAMPGGGTIQLETAAVSVPAGTAGRAAGRYVMIAVRDHGTGMTPEVRERALEPFFTTKEAGKGTGLGLSMVMGFVEQSGGFLDIETEPGEGTRISLYLPAAAAPHDQGGGAAAPAWLPGPVRTLLVEDEDAVRAATLLMCREIGLDVTAVGSAAAALGALRNDADIALLITDIVMPGTMSGAELGQVALAITPGLNVLYTSGHNQSPDLARVTGNTQFLAKPYRKAQLLEALRQLLDVPA